MNPDRPRCTDCGAFLASDNPGPLCSPCWRSGLFRHASRAIRPGRDPVVVADAFEKGGVLGVARSLGCPLEEAVEISIVFGLVPGAYRRRVPLLVRLLELDSCSHVDAAHALGLSRWTVATYRRDLGILEHRTSHRLSA
jgi:hypothetical protein